MSVSPPDLRGQWTVSDLENLPDDGFTYELVDGHLVVTPPPTQQHQLIGDALREVLAVAAPPGWRCSKEFPIVFAEDTWRQPDVVVFRTPPLHPRPDERNPVGPEDIGLVAEVVSPSTRRTDRFAKPGEYADAGIGLYWRLETEPELVLYVQTLEVDGIYGRPVEIRGSGEAATPWGALRVVLSELTP